MEVSYRVLRCCVVKPKNAILTLESGKKPQSNGCAAALKESGGAFNINDRLLLLPSRNACYRHHQLLVKCDIAAG
jgi:hypothetical protein